MLLSMAGVIRLEFSLRPVRPLLTYIHAISTRERVWLLVRSNEYNGRPRLAARGTLLAPANTEPFQAIDHGRVALRTICDGLICSSLPTKLGEH